MTDAVTCWTLIRDSNEGDGAARDLFAQRYTSPISAYLKARWRGTRLIEVVADATQDVFVELFKDGGVMQRADDRYEGGFRSLLFAVVRNVARRFEERRKVSLDRRATSAGLDDRPVAGDSASRIFDKKFAAGMMKLAAEAMRTAAEGEAATRRYKLLRERFAKGRPIREVAELWDVSPDQLHRDYALAREEFRVALRGVIAEHCDGTQAELDRRSEELLELLG